MDVPGELQHPSLYINRELSLLEFNRRVLSMARDKCVPLFERLRYLCICSNNMDEFFEIRVAGPGSTRTIRAVAPDWCSSPSVGKTSVQHTQRRAAAGVG